MWRSGPIVSLIRKSLLLSFFRFQVKRKQIKLKFENFGGTGIPYAATTKPKTIRKPHNLYEWCMLSLSYIMKTIDFAYVFLKVLRPSIAQNFQRVTSFKGVSCQSTQPPHTTLWSPTIALYLSGYIVLPCYTAIFWTRGIFGVSKVSSAMREHSYAWICEITVNPLCWKHDRYKGTLNLCKYINLLFATVLPFPRV